MAVPVRGTGIYGRHSRFTETTIIQSAVQLQHRRSSAASSGQRPTHSDQLHPPFTTGHELPNRCAVADQEDVRHGHCHERRHGV